MILTQRRKECRGSQSLELELRPILLFSIQFSLCGSQRPLRLLRFKSFEKKRQDPTTYSNHIIALIRYSKFLALTPLHNFSAASYK